MSGIPEIVDFSTAASLDSGPSGVFPGPCLHEPFPAKLPLLVQAASTFAVEGFFAGPCWYDPPPAKPQPASAAQAIAQLQDFFSGPCLFEPFPAKLEAAVSGLAALFTNPLAGKLTIEAALANDTGLSATDRLTSDAGIAGSLSGGRGGIDRLEIAVDRPGPGRAWHDVTDLLQPGGGFLIDHDAIEDLVGPRGLRDGEHTVFLRASDGHGGTATTRLSFDLDTVAPRLLSVDLDRASDTGHRGDGRTETAIVDLVGQATRDSIVSVDGIETVAGRNGRFTLDDLMLDLGTHEYTIVVTDAAGNSTTSALTLTRLENSIVHWNGILLDAIRDTGTAPMYATRLLAIGSMAMLEVVEALDGGPSFDPRWGGMSRGGASMEAAIAQAAYDVLMGIYAADSGPYRGSDALRAGFAEALEQALAEVPDGRGEQRGILLGSCIAQRILAERADDGWNAFVDPAGEIGTAPGDWRPTPAGFANPLAPQWGGVDPWVVMSSDQFMPPPPPALDSDQYVAEYNETKSYGAFDSSVRTADQTEIALFWADGAGTITPPGHWNEIAGEVAQAEGRTTAEMAALFARLNVALADAAITCWEAKYTFDYWRPVTAIRLGDSDGNDATIGDAGWKPLIATPPFPEYTSGHSTFSGAAATILTAEFGEGYAFTTGTTDPALAGVTRSFASFWDAAREAGQSRIYGGIHFQSGNQEGLECGRQIGTWVLANFTA